MIVPSDRRSACVAAGSSSAFLGPGAGGRHALWPAAGHPDAVDLGVLAPVPCATNREVALRLSVSPRTVDHHLRNVFAALGVRSRVELSRWVDRAEKTTAHP